MVINERQQAVTRCLIHFFAPFYAYLAAIARLLLLTLPRSHTSDERTSKPNTEADWHPLDFNNTQPISLSFSYTDVPARPYRPWHNGPYHTTMGIKRTTLDDWVEIDHEYVTRYNYKRQLFRDHPSLTVCSVPGSEEACFEALSYMVEFLPRRYPTLFLKTDMGIKNLVTGDDWDLTRDSSTWQTHHPLQVMGLLTTEDWFVLQTDADEQTTRLTAGAVCFPAGWRLPQRIGMSLSEIHTPSVPHYPTKLRASMDRFFLRLRPDQPYMRFNYAIDLSGELFHPEAHHNLTKEVFGAGGGERAGNAGLKVEDLWLRVERQTLQRLPKTGAVLFGIRTYVTRMVEVTTDKEVARALKTQIESYGEEVGRYKNKGLWWEALRRHLDEVVLREEGEMMVDTGDQVLVEKA